VPLGAELLPLTPISAFRPRRWRGALLPSDAGVVFEILEAEKRPVAAVADYTEVRDVRRVEVREDRAVALTMLFDPDHGLSERIIRWMARGTDLKAKRRSVRDDGWRLPDALWARMEPLLPPRPKHPLGCHNPRVPDRAAMDAIFFVLRTGASGTRSGDGHLLVLLGAPALPGVGRGRSVRGVLARGAAGLRRPSRHRLDVAGAGRGDGQGAAGRGGKTGPNPTDRGKRGVSARC
jgi:hypothetical protein